MAAAACAEGAKPGKGGRGRRGPYSAYDAFDAFQGTYHFGEQQLLVHPLMDILGNIHACLLQLYCWLRMPPCRCCLPGIDTATPIRAAAVCDFLCRSAGLGPHADHWDRADLV